jgi:hypothetical protein
MKIPTSAVATATLIFMGQAVAAEPLYVAKIHMLQTDGKFVEYPLKGTESGVSKVECEMRKGAWLKKFEGVFENAKKVAADQGMTADMKITCERKESR